MKAYKINKYGTPKTLQISEVSEPCPNDKQVKVKIKTIGLNYAEIQSRKGLYGWAPKLPYILGMECYGEIIQTGSKCTKRKQGDLVIVGTQFGSYAEYIVVDENQALPAIQNFTSEENAAFAVNYMTAWVSLIDIARLKSSDTVLIQVAAGGVGTAAVQIAKSFGCKVFGTASSDEKIELLKTLNVDVPINYKTTDFSKIIRNNMDGNGVDVILEVVGGDVFKKSINLLNPFGRIVVAGFASLDLKKWNPISWINTYKSIPRASVTKLGESSTGFMATHLGYLLKKPDLMTKVWSELIDFTLKHKIKPIIGHTFSFSEIPKAHELMESRNSKGKIVIQVAD